MAGGLLIAQGKRVDDIEERLNRHATRLNSITEVMHNMKIKWYPGAWKIFVPICTAIMMLGLGLAYGSTGDWFSGFLWSAAAVSTVFGTIVGFQR